MQPDKLDINSADITAQNVEKLRQLFPSVYRDGKIDFDALKNLVGDIIEPNQEYYNFTWAGKSNCFKVIREPSTATLIPMKEESVDFDNTENIFIEGDNLEVLKALQKTYHGKIKMIYIDPPYNKDKDFVYPDRWSEGLSSYLEYAKLVDEEGNITSSDAENESVKQGRKHSRWLSMMYPRLFLAKNLLKDDGVIFISIDDDEVANLRKLCDEIYGEENFLAELIWDKQHSQQQGIFKKYHETVLLYSKNKDLHSNISGGEGIIDAGAMKKISKANPESPFKFPAGVKILADNGTKFEGTYGDSEKVSVLEGEFIAFDNKTKYDVVLSAGWTQKNQMISWFNGEETFDSKGQKIIEFYFTSTGKLKCKKERTKITPPTLLPKFGMVSEQTEKLVSLMGGNYFDNPKPIEMIKLFASWFTGKDDIVLDFFSGSATTAHAIMDLNSEDDGNRTFILVQLPEPTDEKSEAYKDGYKTISEIGKERIRRAGKKIFSETPNINTGCKVFKLGASNFMQWNEEVKDKAKLTQQFEYFKDNVVQGANPFDMLYEVILKKGLSLNSQIDEILIGSKTMYQVNSEGVELLACFESHISKEDIDAVIEARPIYFICLDNAFEGNDKLKTNATLEFKDAEILFETV